MTPQRVRNPILPGNRQDRTGTAGILRRASAAIRRRWAGLQAEVLAIFDRIPVYGQNDVAQPAARTIYAMTPEEAAATSQALQDALDRWIGAERDVRHVLWWEPFPEEAMHLGSAQSVANLTQLSPAYAAARSLQTVVFSQPYRNRVAMAQLKSYEHWTGISAGMRSELSQIIGRAVVDGKSPRRARAEIMERLDVSKSKALEYAQTDITDTLRQARMAEADHAIETMGLNIGLLWTSALIPTTRPWHASRNGKAYSTAEVRAFYQVNGNIFRCHCATTECLLDDNGAPIITKGAKDSMRKELETWQKAAEKK
jgi:uncharacterized protein with gpF-like domain